MRFADHRGCSSASAATCPCRVTTTARVTDLAVSGLDRHLDRARALDDELGKAAEYRATGPDPASVAGRLRRRHGDDVGISPPRPAPGPSASAAGTFRHGGHRPCPPTTTATGSSTSPRIVRRSAGGSSAISSRSISAGGDILPATTRQRPHRPGVLPSVDHHVAVRRSSSCRSDRMATFPCRATTTATASPTWRSTVDRRA